MRLLKLLISAAAAMAFAAGSSAISAERVITVASTTSTEQSGLFAHLLPVFEQETGIKVRVVALGTGQALDTARRGDADVVFVHDKAAEEKFIAEGYGVERKEVMYNDFILVGPKADPAQAGGKEHQAAVMHKSLIAMGASTGGTEALAAVLKSLRPPMPGIVVYSIFHRCFPACLLNGLTRNAS